MTVRVRDVFALILAFAACAASGQGYPVKPVRVLVGFSAGSTTDVMMRVIAPKLAELWGRGVVVDNRAGAGGNIAAEAVARAAPDGYAILFANGGIAVSSYLYKNLQYNARNDLVPISLVTLMPHIVCVTRSLQLNSVSDLIALARSGPNKVLYSSAGVGNSDHMATELFSYMTGVKMTHVPHKGGPEALNDVISGQVAVYFAGMPTGLPPVIAGKVRGIAVTTAKRSSAAPDIPTLAEAGVPGYEYSLWNGLFAPVGTPPAVIEKISIDVAHVVAMNDVRERFTSFGIETVGSSPSQFKEFFVTEIEKWAKVIKATGIQLE